jgi:hypothetical protein
MARIRTVKPDIRKDQIVSSWPIEVRWTFVGLFGYCDDEGRGEDNPLLVKAELYPLDEPMTSRKVEHHLQRIAASGPLCRYEANGRRWFHLVSFGKHQVVNRPRASVIPPCAVHESADQTAAPITEPSVKPHGRVTEPSLPEREVEREVEVAMEQGTETTRRDSVDHILMMFRQSCTEAGRTQPTAQIKNKIAYSAKRLLAEGIPIDELLIAAKAMARTPYDDLDRQVNIARLPRTPKSTTNDRVGQALALAEKYREAGM